VGERCPDLDPFFDGELTEAEAAAFRNHLATCERCQVVLRGRMQEEAVIGAGYQHVEQPNVIAANRAHGHAHRRRIVYLAPILVAAAALVIWFIPPRDPVPPKTIEVSLTIERSGVVMRSSSVHVGDILRYTVHGERHRAIWVYLGDRDLVMTCPGSAQCRSTDDALTLELRVPVAGQYSVIALGSANPIMEPHGVVDVMLDVAAAAGAHIEIKHLEVY
jgi:hypothetical protein